jgi:hypothetical protein
MELIVDSFKIFAQNGLKNNFAQKKINRHVEYLDRKIEEYESQLNETDTKDNALIKAKIAEKLSWRKKYVQITEELKQNGENQIRLIDPDTRSLVSTKYISGVGYNVQAVADGRYKLFLYNHIGENTDKRELATPYT